jgi:hypothetical protein
MRSKKPLKKAGRGSLSNAFINIVGRNMQQNELLLSFLKKETGLKGACFPNLESIPAFDAKEPVIPQLLILDCQDVDKKNLWTSIHKIDNPKPSQYFFALCNVEPESGVENKAMANGIQGIFYNNDPIAVISKGVCAILNGDIWYSRKTLKKILTEKHSPSHSLAHPALAHLKVGKNKYLPVSLRDIPVRILRMSLTSVCIPSKLIFTIFIKR